MSDPTSNEFFEQVRDALMSAVAPEYSDFGGYAHGTGVKITFGTGEQTKEHYEAQIIRGRTKGSIELEIGFHAEHTKVERNEAVIDALHRQSKRWRKVLGPDPVVGEFLGNERWRRVSETWDTFDFRDLQLAFEVADRLAEYIESFEPLLGRSR
jgi:hypothetical protein